MDEYNAVVITDLRVVYKNHELRKASVIVLVLEQPNRNLIRQLIMAQHFSSAWHHMAKIICIVPTRTSLQTRVSLLQAFTSFGLLNVVIVHEDESKNIVADVVVSISGLIEIYTNINDSSKLFPDKLKNMAGYRYKIVLHEQPPIVQFRNQTVTGPMIHFLKAVLPIQNADLRFNIVPSGRSFQRLWETRQMDLTLNTAAVFDNPEPKLMNYEKKGFCALIPIPQKSLTFRLMIIMPFDYLIWVPLVISIACSVAVWWLYRGRGAVDSHWLLLAEIYKMFFGQGFTLSRKNHFMLLTLMQLLCWLIFVISNAYESEITSCMIEPLLDNRLKTLDDLLNSDYDIITEEGFAFVIKENKQFQAIKSRITVFDFHTPHQFEKEVISQKFVLLTLCDVIQNIVNRKLRDGSAVSNEYYMLPETIIWEFVRLEAGYLNPFVERLQYYMDLSFQAGLPHMWKVFENQDQMTTSVSDNSDTLESLKIEDLHEVFKVLGIGLSVSALVFLFEIFYHDCLVNINASVIFEHLRLKVRVMIDQIRKPKMKVRKIFVQPQT